MEDSMANVDFPRGFVPVRGRMDTEDLPISSTNGEIGLYDLIERRTDGFYHPAQATSITIVGVAAHHVDANTGGTVKVYTDPNLRFHAQMDEAEVDAQTDLDLNYNIVASAPNAVSGRSTMEIDSSTQAATATLPIKVLRVVDIITASGNALGANVLVECIINNHLHKSTGVIG